MGNSQWNRPDPRRPRANPPKWTTAPKQPEAPRAAPFSGLWKARKGRLSTSMVALSAAAIASVYAVGYVTTSSADGGGAPLLSAAVASPAATTPVVTGDPSATPAATQAPAVGGSTSGTTQQPTATPTAAPQASGYKDGTYVGVGTSRHGDIEATVVISGGQITSAAVSNCQTRYPCSRVKLLVAEVVDIQSAPVHYVSGATDSSRAYAQAVTNALAQAQA